MWCNEMKANVDRVGASVILRTVPLGQSFLFFEDIGTYTGRLAANLDDFCEIVKTIDVKSLTFHFRRGDYERWIRESLHDVQLARRLKRIKKSNSGEELRNKILQAARRRLDELHEMKKTDVAGREKTVLVPKRIPRKTKTKRTTLKKKTKPKTTKTAERRSKKR